MITFISGRIRAATRAEASICAAGRFASSRPDESMRAYSEAFALGVGRCGRGTLANRDRVNHFGRARR
jgi:hypothetical protein